MRTNRFNRKTLKEAYVRGYRAALKRLNESPDTQDAIDFMEWVSEDLEYLLKHKFHGDGEQFADELLASRSVLLLNELQFMKNADNYADWYEEYFDDGVPVNLIKKATKDFLAKNPAMKRVDKKAFVDEVVEQFHFFLSYISSNFGTAY